MTNSRQCLEFWYFMYGAHVGTLSVQKLSGVFAQQRWVTSGGKGFEWYHAQVNLQSSTSPIQHNLMFVCENSRLNFFNLSYFFLDLRLKEVGQQIIVVQLLLMI